MKSVFTFVSTTKAYVSASLNNRPDVGTPWDEETEADVVIDGNKINLTLHNNVHTTTLEELIVTDINDSEFSTNFKVNKYVDGNLVHSDEHVFHYVKAPTDYRTDIIGTWEGHCTSAGSVFDDGQEHRWQYKADGTYVYYVKDGDDWVPSENTLNEYFVDGTLLCTRWVDNEQENREWWEINIDGDKMNWTALRQKEDGTTFTATFEMTKVVE
jgi:archaellum component FlaG (FlaF/FlaG flagellin family)